MTKNMQKSFKNYCKTVSPENLNKEFLRAVEEGRLEDVQLLLTSPYLKEHVDIHYDEDEPFRSLLRTRNMEILNYFIFDMNIDKTEFIVEHLDAARIVYRYREQEKNCLFIDEVTHALEKRILKDELTVNLPTENKNKIKKAKL
jgi:hypothetical protein